jgi:hypothetical protein
MRTVVPFSVAESCCPAAVEHDYAGDDNQGLEAAMEVLKSMPLPAGGIHVVAPTPEDVAHWRSDMLTSSAMAVP